MSEGFDLYEFPKDWVGRKTYVSVQGHSRSVPKLYTYKGTNGRNYVLPEYGGDLSGYSSAGPMIIRDMAEFVSVVDGSVITSRSTHREHMKRHELIEVGNERMTRREVQLPRAGHDIKRALEQLRSRS